MFSIRRHKETSVWSLQMELWKSIRMHRMGL